MKCGIGIIWDHGDESVVTVGPEVFPDSTPSEAIWRFMEERSVQEIASRTVEGESEEDSGYEVKEIITFDLNKLKPIEDLSQIDTGLGHQLT